LVNSPTLFVGTARKALFLRGFFVAHNLRPRANR
jgi:hypothetical protein